ncbi:MAG: tol-pal system protein YbgF [Pseudomonadales bacterium]
MTTFRGHIAAGVLLALPLAVVAATPGQPQPNAGAADSSAAVGDRRLNELFYQLQVLQQEVQELRGLIEEQSYQLSRLARDQQEQYIDLDRRVAGLTTGGAGGSRAPAQASSAPATAFGSAQRGAPVVTIPPPLTIPGSSAAGSGTSVSGAPAATTQVTQPVTQSAPRTGAGLSERDAYTAAFDLMKGRQFKESIAAFSDLITAYPNGQYTPNAYYWLGELYLAEQNAEQARQAFMQVISLYPDHPKVPDTLYKLGVTYHRIGDNARAMEYFNRVRSEFPSSSAAGLATSYAAELR